MRGLDKFEIGVMFWAGRVSEQTPSDAISEVAALGIHCGQLGIPGDLLLDESLAEAWREALTAGGFPLATVFAAYSGESYADIPTVERTVGFIPPATRAERLHRTLEISDFSAKLDVSSIATHIGFVPEDPTEPDYLAVREMVRRVCDHCANHHQTFALETGQESADTLLDFLIDVNRPNLGINFDPANLILYGTGDPIDALGKLGAHVLSVHCKDGNWPAASEPGALGSEQPLGSGSVGIGNFLRKLHQIGYAGPLCIEREGTDHARWLTDVGTAVWLLRASLSAL